MNLNPTRVPLQLTLFIADRHINRLTDLQTDEHPQETQKHKPSISPGTHFPIILLSLVLNKSITDQPTNHSTDPPMDNLPIDGLT